MTVELRVLRTATELSVLPAFEARIWGEADPPVSVNMLVACVDEGGVAIGAFDGDRLVGSVFGFRTAEPHVLHSHYLAVAPERRRAGLGEALKRRQAAWCREHGVTAMRWTFDPLRLANAHLNLEKLGAVGIAYHVDHYGALGGINGALPSDRLTVQWELVAGRPEFTDHAEVAVAPVTPEQITATAPEALAARLALRDVLAPRLAEGWCVVGVDQVARRYRLGRPATGTGGQASSPTS